ncbi:MAG TPA: PIG-L family deacetylase, partial [Thermoanaerobaculia bacterium]
MRAVQVLLLLLLLGILATPRQLFAQRTRAARTPDFSRLLVVTAHPDDESLFAPLLGARCGITAECTLLVMTRGENGPCVLAAGCGPDLAATRSAELTAATALLQTRLDLWTLPDVMSDVLDQWG